MSVRYNRVEPTIWDEAWTEDARYLGLYLLTCRHRTTEGLYRLPVGYAIGDLGWSAERFQEPFDDLVLDGFMEYDPIGSVIWIVKAFERQPPENVNVAKAAVRRLKELPKTALLKRFVTVARTLSEPFAKVLDEEFPDWQDERYANPLALAPPLTTQSSTATQPLRATAEQQGRDW